MSLGYGRLSATRQRLGLGVDFKHPPRKGVLPPLPSGFAFRTFGGRPLNLNGTYPIYRVS